MFLKPGDTISAEDFDKVRWDAMNSEGGSFRFMPVDAQGADVPGWTAQTVTVREYPDYPDYPEAPPTHVVPQDAMLALPATVFAGNRPASSPAFIQITAIDATIQDGTGSPPMLKGEDGRLRSAGMPATTAVAASSSSRWMPTRIPCPTCRHRSSRCTNRPWRPPMRPTAPSRWRTTASPA